MSLLSATQGRPERVRSLLRLLAAFDGTMERSEAMRWMMPAPLMKAEPSTSAFDQTLDAAVGLELASRHRGIITLTAAGRLQGLALDDHIHEVLCRTGGADAVMMAAYAYFTLRSDKERGTAWIGELGSVKEVADAVANSLKESADDETRAFNSTKLPPWRAWMVQLGLAFESSALPTFFPFPARRLERVIEAIAERQGHGIELGPDALVMEIVKGMPYLQGGHIYVQLEDKIGGFPRGQGLGYVLSTALRELHDSGKLQLLSRGDATGSMGLAEDRYHPLKHFYAVRLLGEQVTA